MATFAAPSPNVIDWKARARVPLIALTVALVALDAIGLGLRWADVSNNSISEVTPRVLRPRVTSPHAVVAGSDLTRSSSSSFGSSNATRIRSGSGSGSSGSGAFIGPVAPPVVHPTPGSSPSPSPKPSSSPSPAVPLAQADAAVPGVVQVSAGAGDSSCTTVGLTLLAPSNCPTPTGDGPVIVHLGGSLLGPK